MQPLNTTPKFSIFQVFPFCDATSLIAPQLLALLPHARSLFTMYLWNKPLSGSLTFFFSVHNDSDCKTECPNKGNAALES